MKFDYKFVAALAVLALAFVGAAIIVEADDSDAATYTVYFDAGTGGTVSKSSQSSTNTTDNFSVTATPNTGYTFDGWYDMENTRVSTSTTFTGNIYQHRSEEFTAKFSVQTTYIVYFDAGTGGTVSKSSQSSTSTTATFSCTASANTGYTFDGWYDMENSRISTSATLTGNISQNDRQEFTAKFTAAPVSYTCYLYYNANGGSGAPSTQSYTGSSTSNHYFTVSNTTPTRSGYTFLGWSTSQYSSTASYHGGDSISVSYNGSKTLYAVWQEITYTCYLYYNANGGSGAPSTQSYTGSSTSSHSFTISNTAPTRNGYNFLGWSESSSASTASYHGGDSISVSYNGSKTLYAIWQYVYIVYFDASPSAAGSVSQATATATNTSATFSVTASANAGYDFLGWYDAEDSQVSSNATFTGNIYQNDRQEYTAKFTNSTYNYSLSYDANGGSGAPSASTWSGTTLSHSFTVSATAPTRAHYNFLGWADSASASTAAYTSGDTITLYSSNPTKTIYAVWQQEYIVYFDADPSVGGSVSQATATATNTTDNFSITATANAGYDFLGWYDAEDSQVSSSTTYTGNIYSNNLQEYTAKFQLQVTYIVYFDADPVAGGSVSQATASSTNQTDNFSVTATANAGYDFLGWYDAEDTQVSSNATFTGNIYSNNLQEYTAKFQIQATYVVYFDADPAAGGTVSQATATSNNQTDNYSVTATANEGYRFLGWYDMNDDLVTTDAAITGNIYADDRLEYTAKFELIVTYTVYFDADPADAGSVSQATATSTNQTDNFSVTATPDLGYRFLGWYDMEDTQVSSNPTFSGNIYLNNSLEYTAKFVEISDDSTFWSNGNYNGRVDLLYKFSASDNVSHTMVMSLYTGTVENSRTTWTDSGYELQIELSYPSLQVVSTLYHNGSVIGTPVTKTLGNWNTFVISISSEDGKITITPVKTFNSFVDFTLYQNQAKEVFNFSNTIKDTAIETIAHSEDGEGANQPLFSVVSTKVFLNTYGVVLYNPTINLHDYFPQYDAIRVNFYSFALYGSQITINDKTYPVTDGHITIQYVSEHGNHYLPDVMPNATPQTRTFALTNLYVTYENGVCYLTFVNDRFTIDLGTYTAGNETISMQGLWYFATMVYEPYTVTEKTLSDWKILPETNKDQMLLIFIGILAVAGVAVALHARKNGLGYIDVAVIGAAAVIAFILLG